MTIVIAGGGLTAAPCASAPLQPADARALRLRALADFPGIEIGVVDLRLSSD